MDIMKIESGFMTGIVSKLVNFFLHRKGIDAKVELKKVQVEFQGDNAHVHLNIDADMSKSELDKIMKSIGL